LEEEKKQYTTIISELEERLAQLEVREADHMRQEEEWKTMQQRYDQYIQNLELEKEEMVRRHTLETGDLRKKNAYLTDHIQKMDSTAMSAVPSSSGFSHEFSDMDNMTVDNFWENPSYIDDFQMDTTVRSDSSLIKKSTISDDDKPAASGLLLIVSVLC
jgi:chromosome segregation ATPase